MIETIEAKVEIEAIETAVRTVTRVAKEATETRQSKEVERD